MGIQSKNMVHLNLSDTSAVVHWSTKCIAKSFNATEFENSVEQFADSHSHEYTAFAVIGIVLGLLMLFAGYSLFYFTLGAAGFLLGGCLGFFLLCGATSEVVAAAVAGAVCALFVGFIVTKVEKLGGLTVGIAGGLVAAIYTNGFVMTHLYNQFSALNQSWMPYVYAGLPSLVGIWLAFKLERILIIVVTSFGGAYAIGWATVRLIYGDEHTELGPIYLFSGNGCEDKFCKLALAAICVLAMVGIAVQINNTAESKNRFSRDESGPQDVYVLPNSNDHTVLLINGKQVKNVL